MPHSVSRARTDAVVETAVLAIALSGLLSLRRPPSREKGLAASAAGERGLGRQAETPAAIPRRGWIAIGKRVYAGIGDDRILAVAAGVTFYGLLAMFPAIAAFVSIFGLVADPATISDQLAALGGVMPGGALDVIGEQIKRIASADKALGVALVAGIATSIWSANAGAKAVFDALNVAYREKEKRGFVRLNLTSLAFTVGGVLFLMAALGIVVVIPVVLNFVGLGLGVAAEWLIRILRWPFLFAVLIIALGLLYRFGPSRVGARWVWLSPGALLAGIGWVGFSMLFSLYVGQFGNYNATYGSLGAVIGFMTWMWLSATIILVGAELNAETEHQTAVDTTVGAGKPLGSRGAVMADSVAPATGTGAGGTAPERAG